MATFHQTLFVVVKGNKNPTIHYFGTNDKDAYAFKDANKGRMKFFMVPLCTEIAAPYGANDTWDKLWQPTAQEHETMFPYSKASYL